VEPAAIPITAENPVFVVEPPKIEKQNSVTFDSATNILVSTPILNKSSSLSKEVNNLVDLKVSRISYQLCFTFL
jgi:hypothetical protein